MKRELATFVLPTSMSGYNQQRGRHFSFVESE